MRQMSLSEVQETNVETLFKFAEYCDSKGLSYFLAYGTLLGAVRHQGIIPWDDDIDVWMPRKDYETFCASFNRDAMDGTYRFYNMENDQLQYDYRGIVADERTLHSYGRRVTDLHYGLHIDVFPLDYQDDSERKRKRLAKKTYRLVDMAHRFVLADESAYLSRHSFIHGIAFKVSKLICNKVDFRRLMQREDRRAKHHPASNWLGIIGDPSAPGYPAAWFSEKVDLMFCGKKLHAPIEYDKILQMQYGDYMTYPPEEQRHPYGKGFWRE